MAVKARYGRNRVGRKAPEGPSSWDQVKRPFNYVLNNTVDRAPKIPKAFAFIPTPYSAVMLAAQLQHREFVGETITGSVSQSKNMARYLPRGMWELANHPFKTSVEIGKSYADYYGPLFQGDFGAFEEKFLEEPLNPLLDAIGVATLGAGATVRIGGAIGKAGQLGRKVKAEVKKGEKSEFWTKGAADNSRTAQRGVALDRALAADPTNVSLNLKKLGNYDGSGNIFLEGDSTTVPRVFYKTGRGNPVAKAAQLARAHGLVAASEFGAGLKIWAGSSKPVLRKPMDKKTGKPDRYAPGTSLGEAFSSSKGTKAKKVFERNKSRDATRMLAVGYTFKKALDDLTEAESSALAMIGRATLPEAFSDMITHYAGGRVTDVAQKTLDDLADPEVTELYNNPTKALEKAARLAHEVAQQSGDLKVEMGLMSMVEMAVAPFTTQKLLNAAEEASVSGRMRNRARLQSLVSRTSDKLTRKSKNHPDGQSKYDSVDAEDVLNADSRKGTAAELRFAKVISTRADRAERKARKELDRANTANAEARIYREKGLENHPDAERKFNSLEEENVHNARLAVEEKAQRVADADAAAAKAGRDLEWDPTGAHVLDNLGEAGSPGSRARSGQPQSGRKSSKEWGTSKGTAAGRRRRAEAIPTLEALALHQARVDVARNGRQAAQTNVEELGEAAKGLELELTNAQIRLDKLPSDASKTSRTTAEQNVRGAERRLTAKNNEVQQASDLVYRLSLQLDAPVSGGKDLLRATGDDKFSTAKLDELNKATEGLGRRYRLENLAARAHAHNAAVEAHQNASNRLVSYTAAHGRAAALVEGHNSLYTDWLETASAKSNAAADVAKLQRKKEQHQARVERDTKRLVEERDELRAEKHRLAQEDPEYYLVGKGLLNEAETPNLPPEARAMVKRLYEKYGDAAFDREHGMSAPELRELAKEGFPFYQPDQLIAQSMFSLEHGEIVNTGQSALWGEVALNPSLLSESFFGTVRAKLHQDLSKYLEGLHKTISITDAKNGKIPRGYMVVSKRTRDQLAYVGSRDRRGDSVKDPADAESSLNEDFGIEGEYFAATDSDYLLARNTKNEVMIAPVYAVKTAKREAKRTSNMIHTIIERPLTTWRAIVLGTRPAFIVNNFVGNHFMYAIAWGGMEGLAGYAEMVAGATKESAWMRSLRGKTGEALENTGPYGRWVAEDSPSANIAKVIALTQMPDVVGVGATLMGRNAPVLANRARGGLANISYQYTSKVDGKRKRRTPRDIAAGTLPIASAITENNLRSAALRTELRREGREAGLIGRAARTTNVLKRLNLMKGETVDFNKMYAELFETDPQMTQRVADAIGDGLGNYFDMTPFERNAVRNAVPFYSWNRVITGVVMRMPFDHPLKAGFLRAIALIGIEEADNANGDTPDFLLGALSLRPGQINALPGIGHIPGRTPILTMQGINPLETVVGVLEAGEGFLGGDLRDVLNIGVSPMIAAPIEAVTGRSLFTGGESKTGLSGVWGIPERILRPLPPVKLLEKALSSNTRPEGLYEDTFAKELYGQLGIPVKQVNLETATKLANLERARDGEAPKARRPLTFKLADKK